MFQPRRSLATLLLIALNVTSLWPFMPTTAAPLLASPAPLRTISPAPSLPPTNWSAIDWDEEIMLAKDVDAMRRQREELLAAGKTKEAAALQTPRHRRSDEDVLVGSGAPEDIKELVRHYRGEREVLKKQGAPSDRLEAEKRLLEVGIQKLYPELRVTNPTEDLKNSIDVRTAPRLKIQHLIPIENNPAVTAEIKIDNNSPKSSPLYNTTLQGLQEKLERAGKVSETLRVGKKVSFSWWDKVKLVWSVPEVMAATPLIAYYNGIEKKPLDFALYYLSQQQNVDGSFGSTDVYATTVEAVFMLNEVGRTTSDQYTAAVNYVVNTAPQNNREKVLKARVLWALSQPFQALLDDVAATQNKDGGYGLKKDFASDALTTADVALTFYLANYSLQDKTPRALLFVLNQIGNDGTVRYTPESSPSFYLMNRLAQLLLPLRNLIVSDGQNQVRVESKAQLILSYLRSQFDTPTQDLIGADGAMDRVATIRTWQLYGVDADKIIVLSAHAISLQQGNGSFDSNAWTTAMALLALKQADIVVTDVTSVGNLVNRTPASLQLTIKNQGYATAGTSTLHIFVDGYYFDAIVTNLNVVAGQVLNLVIDFDNTMSFIEATEFKIFVENSLDSDYDNNWITKNFTFLSAANNSPATPVYFIAQKYVINGEPALNIRWSKKSDANRLKYVVLWRPKGAAQWNYAGIDTNSNGAFLNGAFGEGTVYEVTAGVLHQDANTITFSSKLIEVKTSADESKYLGAATGFVTENAVPLPFVGVMGYSVNANTDANGLFAFQPVGNGSSAAAAQPQQYDSLTSSFLVPVNATTTQVRIFSRLKDDNAPPTVTSFEIRFKQNFIVKNQKEVELLALGNDNVGVKEADFYLWDTTEQSWIYLGTQGAQSYSQVMFKWYVPSSVLGDGYKVKTILRDYRGNESAPKEWGPFKVTDGTPPTFTVVSPNGGETWALGSTGTIKWTVTSTNSVSPLSLKILYPRSTQYLTSNAPNTGSYNWTIPLSSQYAGAKIKASVRGYDTGNSEYGEDESDTYFTIADSSPAPLAPWAYPTMLSVSSTTSTTALVLKDNVQVAVDTSGVTHLVYRYIEDDTFANPRVIKEQLIYRQYANNAWSAPQIILENNFVTDANLIGYQPINRLRLVVDASKRPHLTWVRNGPGGLCSTMNQQEIFYMSFNGQEWSAPQNISNNATASADTDLAIDKNNIIHVTWLDGITWDDACKVTGNRKIFYAKKDQNGWSAIEQLSTDTSPYYPHLDTTDDGRVNVVYLSGSKNSLSYIYKNNNVWSAPVDFFSGENIAESTMIQSANVLHYTFRQYYQDPQSGLFRNRILYTSYNGVAWASSTEVSPIITNTSVEYPKITVDGDNKPYVFFTMVNNQTGQSKLAWTAKFPGAWLAPRTVNLASQYLQGSGVAAAGWGNKQVAAWVSDYSFEPEVFVNQADVSGDYTDDKVYEDAEDGDTLGWKLFSPSFPGVYSINNVIDDQIHGRAIEINASNINNDYWLNNEDNTPWNDSTHKHLRFEVKTSADFLAVVHLNTNQGVRHLFYSTIYPSKLAGAYTYIKLDPALKDGAWHTIDRDLQADINLFSPSTTITSVTNFSASGKLRLDNIELKKSPVVFSIAGKVVDGNNQAIPTTTIQLNPGNITAVTDSQGAFIFGNLKSGAYTITPQSQVYNFAPTSTIVMVTSTSAINVQFVGTELLNKVYEDAEDGDTLGWQLYSPSFPGVYSITNVADDQTHGHAIEINASNINNDYWLRNSNNSNWNDALRKNLHFEFKTAADFIAVIHLNTSQGERHIFYSTIYASKVSGLYTYIKLDPTLKDGAWHTIDRDLQADLSLFSPGVTITSVSNFSASGKLRLDNIELRKFPTLFTIAGKITDNNNQPLPTTTVQLNPGNLSVVTNQQGNYAFTDLKGGAYTVTPLNEFYDFTPSSTSAIVVTSSITGLNFVGQVKNEFVYEDAEDGLINGWKLLFATPTNTTITNVVDDVAHGKVIDINIPNPNIQEYQLGLGNNGPWNNPFAKVLSWDMKTSGEMYIYARVDTNQGEKWIMYSFNYPSTVSGPYISFNLSSAFKDGQWHTITRDLQADAASKVPGLTISKVNYFLAGGKGRFDNIKLLKLIAQAGSLNMNLVSGPNASPLTDQLLNIGATSTSVLAFTLTAQAEPMKLTKLKITATGQALVANDLLNLALYRNNEITPFAVGAQMACVANTCSYTWSSLDNILQSPVAPGSPVTIYVKSDIGGAGIAKINDDFKFSIANAADITAVGGMSGAKIDVTGNVAALGKTIIAPFTTIVTPQFPSPGSVTIMTVTTGSMLGSVRVYNNGSAPITVTDLKLTDYGAHTGTTTLFKLMYSDENSSNLLAEAVTSRPNVDFSGFDVPVTINGGSFRTFTVLVANIGQAISGDSFQLGVARLGDVRYSLKESDAGFDGNGNGNINDTLTNLFIEGIFTLGSKVKS